MHVLLVDCGAIIYVKKICMRYIKLFVKERIVCRSVMEPSAIRRCQRKHWTHHLSICIPAKGFWRQPLAGSILWNGGPLATRYTFADGNLYQRTYKNPRATWEIILTFWNAPVILKKKKKKKKKFQMKLKRSAKILLVFWAQDYNQFLKLRLL